MSTQREIRFPPFRTYEEYTEKVPHSTFDGPVAWLAGTTAAAVVGVPLVYLGLREPRFTVHRFFYTFAGMFGAQKAAVLGASMVSERQHRANWERKGMVTTWDGPGGRTSFRAFVRGDGLILSDIDHQVRRQGTPGVDDNKLMKIELDSKGRKWLSGITWDGYQYTGAPRE